MPSVQDSDSASAEGISEGVLQAHAIPAALLLDGVVSCIGQAAEGGNVACVQQSVDQALQVAQSALSHRVGLHSIVGVLPTKQTMALSCVCCMLTCAEKTLSCVCTDGQPNLSGHKAPGPTLA